MSLLVQCPFCPAQIKVAESATLTTCPKCFKSFNSRIREREASATDGRRRPRADADDDEQEESAPSRINPWGAVALVFATLGLLAAIALGNRGLTYTMLGLGIAVVVVGFTLAAVLGKTGNLTWLGVGGAVNVAVLCVVLFAPGLLNRYWAMDQAVPPPDPHTLFAIPDEPEYKQRALAPEDIVDAATNAIGQAGVSARIMSVGMGEVGETGTKRFLLVRVRVSSVGYERAVIFEGFGNDKHRPTLKGASGVSYAFVEQRARKLPAGGVVFVAAAPQTVSIQPTRFLDFLLVFEPPPADFPPLILELPASAWGRNGVCKFRIDRLFEPNIPVAKKN